MHFYTWPNGPQRLRGHKTLRSLLLRRSVYTEMSLAHLTFRKILTPSDDSRLSAELLSHKVEELGYIVSSCPPVLLSSFPNEQLFHKFPPYEWLLSYVI